MWCLAAVVVLLCTQPMSSQSAGIYTDTSCKDIAKNATDCRKCCKRDKGFKGAFMDWDGCYCHNELHRGDAKADEDW